VVNIIGAKAVDLTAGMTGQFLAMRKKIRLSGTQDWERGLTRQQFTPYYLMRLGIGHDLTRIALDPKHPRRLASEAEVLALRPELQHIE